MLCALRFVACGVHKHVRTAKSHVRFTPESGHPGLRFECPLNANSELSGAPSDESVALLIYVIAAIALRAFHLEAE
jgi:hypothetical protein